MSNRPLAHPACQALIQAADLRQGLDEGDCRAVLTLVSSGPVIENSLRRELAACDLSESGFQILALLATHAPEGLPLEGLERQVPTSRASLLATLVRLELSGLLTSHKGGAHSAYVLTAQGSLVFNHALQRALTWLQRLTQVVPSSDLQRAADHCRRLSHSLS